MMYNPVHPILAIRMLVGDEFVDSLFLSLQLPALHSLLVRLAISFVQSAVESSFLVVRLSAGNLRLLFAPKENVLLLAIAVRILVDLFPRGSVLPNKTTARSVRHLDLLSASVLGLWLDL